MGATPLPLPRASALLELFDGVTGEHAAMWRPSIVGYGRHHYVYDSGREGDTLRVGFSPRSSAVTLYGLLGAPGTDELLGRLGPHKASKGCLYVTPLGRTDEKVLRELVASECTLRHRGPRPLLIRLGGRRVRTVWLR